jgi:hypothetical protein
VRKGDTSPDPLYLEAIETRLGTNGGTMSDWFHELPVPWMALLVFGFTYLLALAIHAGVAALARSGRAKSFKAVSPGMLPPLGIISACSSRSPPRRSGAIMIALAQQ